MSIRAGHPKAVAADPQVGAKPEVAANLQFGAQPHVAADPNDTSVSMLIKRLGETDRRIEELTAGEVDTVTDRDGRSYMLRRAQEHWRQSGADQQAAVLDALPAHIVLLDAQGTIVSTNETWRKFADANSLRDPDYAVGRNYLTICDGAKGEQAAEAAHVAVGIRSVLAAATRNFSYEYRCDTPQQRRWFLLTVSPVENGPLVGAAVMHLDITARKRDEEDLRHFAAAMDASPDGIFLVDRADMVNVHVNDAACRMNNLSREKLLKVTPWKLLRSTREAMERTYDDLIRSGGFAEPEETLWFRGNAPPIWIEVRRHAQLLGGRWTIVVLVRDVTARKEAESRIAYLNRVHAVLSGINTLIVRVRNRDELFREACRIAVEQGALAMTWIGIVDRNQRKLVLAASAGMDAEFLGSITRRLNANSLESPGDSLPTHVAKDRRIFVSNDSQNDPQVQFSEFHVKLGVRSMAMFPLVAADETVGVIVLYAHENGFFHAEQLRLLTELAADVAFAIEQIEKQERLDYLAHYDVMTGLANQVLFLDRMSQCLHCATSSGHKLALCLVDLERFKNINDSLGRDAGDSLLRQVAQWLVSDTGDEKMVARIDADRFAVLMPTVVGEEEVAHLVEKTIAAFLAHSFSLNATSYRIAVKVGVALFPDDGTDANVLLKHAESALRKAKGSGDRFLFYAQRMTDTVVARLQLENQLRRAVESDEFVLHYQPKVNVTSGALVGVEALIRWNDPLTGLVPPSRFIPVLEETGLIHEVGRWALNKAMEDYMRWGNAGLPVVRVAVNLSPLQLRNRDLIANIQQVIDANACCASGLELEITESLIMEDIKLSISALKSIRAMGVRVAIDDFGTGFSSLSYLSKLPIDSVKIDRSFIEDMVKGPEGLSLVSIIINLVHSLKLTVVAEGVETEEQARLLRLLNCDEMQGFLLSKPLPAALLEERFLTPK